MGMANILSLFGLSKLFILEFGAGTKQTTDRRGAMHAVVTQNDVNNKKLSCCRGHTTLGDILVLILVSMW